MIKESPGGFTPEVELQGTHRTNRSV